MVITCCCRCRCIISSPSPPPSHRPLHRTWGLRLETIAFSCISSKLLRSHFIIRREIWSQDLCSRSSLLFREKKIGTYDDRLRLRQQSASSSFLGLSRSNNNYSSKHRKVDVSFVVLSKLSLVGPFPASFSVYFFFSIERNYLVFGKSGFW